SRRRIRASSSNPQGWWVERIGSKQLTTCRDGRIEPPGGYSEIRSATRAYLLVCAALRVR
ncbi:MAG TPA: hypothetical protein QF520_14775, partial [SAR202 cluster bacterium]|nr:hypothetical protein [SAR202 cluster bacterium]